MEDQKWFEESLTAVLLNAQSHCQDAMRAALKTQLTICDNFYLNKETLIQLFVLESYKVSNQGNSTCIFVIQLYFWRIEPMKPYKSGLSGSMVLVSASLEI